VVGVHVVENLRLGLDQAFGAGEIEHDVPRLRSTMRPKPPTKCAPLSATAIEREVAEAANISASAGAPDSAGARRVGRHRGGAHRITRAPSSGSPPWFVEHEGDPRSARMFLVCTASREISSSGEPSASLATLTNEQ